MQKRFFSFILFLLLLFACSAFSQQPVFNFVTKPEDDSWGLIKGITQDPQGYMWFASNGLTRYDGLKATHYTHDPLNNNSVASNKIDCILADSKGMIWAGTFGDGIDRFDPINNIFTHFLNKPADETSLINDTITTIIEDREKNIWIGTSAGLAMMDVKTGKFRRYKYNVSDSFSLSNNHVRVLYEDRQGTIWVGTGNTFINDKGVMPGEGGLNCLDKKTGTFTRYLHDPKNPRTLIDNRIGSIYEDRHGNFWVGTAGDGLHKMNRANGTFERYTYDSANSQKLSRPSVKNIFPWCNDHITFITEDAAGALWIGTFSGGIGRYDPDSGKVSFYNYQDFPGGFYSTMPWRAYSSRDGVLWISTFDSKLYRVDPLHKDLPYFKFENALSIREDSNYSFITSSEGLFLIKDQKIERKYIYDSLDKNSISNSYINTIRQDPYGKYWVSTFGGGLNYFDPVTQKFTRYVHNPNDNNSLINNTIRDIIQDKDQDLWIGTVKGLDMMNTKTGKFIHYQNNPLDSTSLSANYVYRILIDSKNQVWTAGGDNGGVNVLDKSTGKFIHYLNGANVDAVFEDSHRIIWISTGDELFTFDPQTKSITPIVDPNTGFKIVDVLTIVEDYKKNLWMVCRSKLLRLDSARKKLVSYGKDFGFKSITIVGVRCQRGPSGDIIFASGNGYYRFFPDDIPHNSVAPQVVLSNFYIDDQLIQPGINTPLKVSPEYMNEIKLSHNQNSFSIDFAILHFANPDNNQDLFMLENYDHSWHHSGAERQARYFNVPPGHYIFHIKAANNMGIWTEKNIDVVVVPAWWETTWFKISIFIIACALAFAGIRWRISNVRKQEQQKAKQKEEKSRVEKEMLELEAKALRAQMNPHFIFNCLNSIKALMQEEEIEKGVKYLTTFSKLIRTLFNNADKKEISLYDEIETCKFYLQLEAMRFDSAFGYAIDVDPEIDLKSVFIPALIIQPFIENAIWHGFVPGGTGGNIRLNVERNNGYVEIIVEDDGIGREVSQQNKSNTGLIHNSRGVNLTQSRLELDNLLKQRNAKIEIIDKTDEMGNSLGTKVIIKIQEDTE